MIFAKQDCEKFGYQQSSHILRYLWTKPGREFSPKCPASYSMGSGILHQR